MPAVQRAGRRPRRSPASPRARCGRRRVGRQRPESVDHVAHVAEWGMIVVRTDPEAPKHHGITYFVIDMHAPGVEVRPLRQITGEAEFNEVFMTDVRIPDSDRIGEVGDGWRVALTTLMNEHVSIGGQVNPRGSGPNPRWRCHRTRRAPSAATPAVRDELMRLWAGAEVEPAHEPRTSRRKPRARDPRTRGFGVEARDGRAEQTDHELRDEPARARGDALRRLHDGPPAHHDGSQQPAEGVPAGAGELDRGWDHQHHEEHPRRAGPRAPRRARAQQPPVELAGASMGHVITLTSPDGA